MTKLAFFDVDEKEQTTLSRAFGKEKVYELSFYRKSLDTHTADSAKDAEGIGIFIQSRITQELLDLLPRLKTIATMSTGFDHIDMDACKARGITVCNVPSYGDNTVAEYAFGLIIALARKLKPTFERVERGIFSRSGLMGTDIKGKTLGLVGTGRIGAHMARLGWAFGMKVIAYDLRPDKALSEKFGVVFTDMEKVLQQADVISLHVPYLPSTHHLINAERLRLFKPAALLVNTSRGKVVDTEAVAAALRKGRLGGVALDTFEGEEVWIEEEFLKRDELAAIPLKEAMESFSIMRSERAILTPHNAFNTREAMDRILITTAENLKAYFSGNPQNQVV
ncbi:D-lactate dehydrogenase [bacterium BMS3Bbin07]|nr:D-lactate dehydrogenase [bacterium BMS3Bbin07]HDY70271.1 hydroxyacid dehydrogenase [Nitrospirota bacterium]